jgi:hypothetical protein
VPYHGWFTADTESNDVAAFEVDANEIPRDLDTLQGNERVEYTRAKIGNGDYLLPSVSETTLMALSGEIGRNHVIFDRCREYAGESSVTLTEPGAIPQAIPSPASADLLPAGTELQIQLLEPIERGVTAIGDLVAGTLMREVRGSVSVPKGSGVTLRVNHMETVVIGGRPVQVVGFQLLRLEWAGRTFEVEGARLEKVRDSDRYFPTVQGRVSFAGRSLRISPGLEMTWRVAR